MDTKTVRTYNKMAEEYDRETTDFWELFPTTILDKFAEFTKGKILDIGSGPGRDGLLLKEKGLDVVCLDASDKMVVLSSARGLTSVVGDFMSIPFQKESFDGAWAYTSLLHVPKSKIHEAFTEIHRVLKKDGIIGLGFIEGSNEEYRESLGNMPRWFSYYTKDELEKILDNQGFEILYFEVFKPKTKNYLNFIARKR